MALVVFSITATVSNAGSEVKGKVTHVRDADTIEVAGIPIRFDGVDAPDRGEPGFEAGKQWMRDQYGGRLVRCILTGAKTYDRSVGACYGSQGEDISAMVISVGLARDCPRYSKGRYKKFEPAESRSRPMKPYCR